MAASPGYKAFFMLDNAAGALQNLSTYGDDISFPQSTEMLEVTTFSASGTAVKRFIPGLNGGDSISFSGPLDTTLHTQIGAMKSAQDAGTAGFSVVYGPAGSVAAAPKLTCEAYIASYEISSGVGGRNEFSCSIQVDGAVVNTAW